MSMVSYRPKSRYLLTSKCFAIAALLVIAFYYIIHTNLLTFKQNQRFAFEFPSFAKYKNTVHILHFGIDGLNPRCIANSSRGTFNIDRVFSRGSGTYQMARTAIETVSAPGWVANLCSMTSASSGITDNSWLPPWSPYNACVSIEPITGVSAPLPTIFTELKARANHSVQTAMFYSSFKWLQFLASSNYDRGLAVDVEKYVKSRLQHITIDYLTEHLNRYISSYTFIYFHDVDAAGHAHGWCSTQYEDAVSDVDARIGRILKALNALSCDSYCNSKYLVVISSDHGGTPGRDNHVWRNEADIVIPLIFMGHGIKTGYKIKRPVRSIDIAPTILHFMGLYSNRHWAWEGRIIKEIFL